MQTFANGCIRIFSFSFFKSEALEAQVPLQTTVRAEQGERQQPNGGVKWSSEHNDPSTIIKHRNVRAFSNPAIHADQETPVSPDITSNTCDIVIPTDGDMKNNDLQIQKSKEDYDKIEVIVDNENINQDATNTVQKQNDDENANADSSDEYEFQLLKWPTGRSWFTKVIFTLHFDKRCYFSVKSWDVLTDDSFYWKKALFQVTWVVTWPIHLIFTFTIPDCEKPRFKRWFPLTFLMCIIWIGSLSYLVAWMITIIGEKPYFHYSRIHYYQ